MHIDINKLKQAQARSGKTLNELGFSRSTMQNIRRGRNVLPTTVYKYAQALGCTVEALLREGDAE